MLDILVVDDELQNRTALQEIIVRMGHNVQLACTGREALEKINGQKYDLVLSDVRMPELDGLELFRILNQSTHLQHKPAFVFMTAYGRIEDAVGVLREGALHFLTKPLRRKDIQMVLDEVTRRLDKVRETNPTMRASMDGKVKNIIYRSRIMADLMDQVNRLAATTASVFIFGESGVGKELIARAIHDRSARAKKPFVAVNVAAIPETVMESELFGHERGSFTGAEKSYAGQIRAAEGGTFFIDEMTSMSLAAQAKWLRVIQEKQVWPIGSTKAVPCDVRWLSASNQDPKTLVDQGRFREDLLYRLQVVTLNVPPLRDRPEDIEPLLEHFLNEICTREKKIVKLSSKIVDNMLLYPWPGNVRELRNVIERVVTLAESKEADLDLLPNHMTNDRRRAEIKLALGTTLEHAQDRLIEETLRMCHGDKAKAARILGINQRTIYRWLETKSTQ
jgi:two-component system response regulator HydG